MKGICYFGARNRHFPRNNGLIAAIKKARIPLFLCFVDSSYSNIRRHAKLIRKFLSLNHSGFDTILLCEFQPTLIFLAFLLSIFFHKKLIFDFESSFYENVENRGSDNTLQKGYFYLLDFFSLHLPDYIITTTNAYRNYICSFYAVKKSKVFRIYYVIPSAYTPYNSWKTGREKFNISCVGTFIAGHGMETIIDAANCLKKYPDIVFNIFGCGQTFESTRQYVNSLGLSNVLFHGKIPREQVNLMIQKSHVMLGNMKLTAKNNKCIPIKVYEAIANNRPVINMHTQAVSEIFRHMHNIILCRDSSAEDLAEKILIAYQNSEKLSEIAENGFKLHQEHSAVDAGADRIQKILSFIDASDKRCSARQ